MASVLWCVVVSPRRRSRSSVRLFVCLFVCYVRELASWRVVCEFYTLARECAERSMCVVCELCVSVCLFVCVVRVVQRELLLQRRSFVRSLRVLCRLL